MKNYICLDLEMTGLNPKEERIIEIGAVKIKDGNIVDEFQSFINPNRKLTREICEITGICDEMLVEALDDWTIIQQFIEFSEGLPFVGHHMITDVAFIKQCTSNHKKEIKIMGVDTLHLARKFLPVDKSKTLTAVADYLEVSYNEAHRALEDAKITYAVYEKLFELKSRTDPDLFQPKEVIYKAKKQGPITPAQLRQIENLLQYHHIIIDKDLSKLTKSEASRIIDKIILQYGRIRSDDV